MRTRMPTSITLISGLLMLAVLGPGGGAQAATRSAQPAASISPADCFDDFALYTYDNGATGYIGADGDLYFDQSNIVNFCQARIAPGSGIVEIFDNNGSGECLALNSTTGAIYLHSASGCASGTADYLQWRFIYIKPDPSTGWPVYAIQNQFQTLLKPCLYDNIQQDPAIYASCASYHTDQFLWFQYAT